MRRGICIAPRQAGRQAGRQGPRTCRKQLLEPITQMGKLRHGSPSPGDQFRWSQRRGGGCRQQAEQAARILLLCKPQSPGPTERCHNPEEPVPGGDRTQGPCRKQGTGTTVTCNLPRPPRRVSGCQTGPWAPSSFRPGPSASHPEPSCLFSRWLPNQLPAPSKENTAPGATQGPQPSLSHPGEQRSSTAGGTVQAGPQQAGLPALPRALPLSMQVFN